MFACLSMAKLNRIIFLGLPMQSAAHLLDLLRLTPDENAFSRAPCARL